MGGEAGADGPVGTSILPPAATIPLVVLSRPPDIEPPHERRTLRYQDLWVRERVYNGETSCPTRWAGTTAWQW